VRSGAFGSLLEGASLARPGLLGRRGGGFVREDGTDLGWSSAYGESFVGLVKRCVY